MNQHTIRAPFFEIGPKSYLYGQDVVDLAIAADKASEKYGVDIIFTTPIVSISAVSYTHLDVYKRQFQSCVEFPPHKFLYSGFPHILYQLFRFCSVR